MKTDVILIKVWQRKNKVHYTVYRNTKRIQPPTPITPAQAYKFANLVDKNKAAIEPFLGGPVGWVAYIDEPDAKEVLECVLS